MKEGGGDPLTQPLAENFIFFNSYTIFPKIGGTQTCHINTPSIKIYDRSVSVYR